MIDPEGVTNPYTQGVQERAFFGRRIAAF